MAADRGPLKVGFGGGCHWCTEAVFQTLRGVSRVDQGFCRSEAPHDGWSEAVIVYFDPDTIAFDVLIAVHLRTHAATSAHKMRGKYRSAIYVSDEIQAQAATLALAREQPAFDAPLVTLVLRHRGFRPSQPQFQNYYATRPDRPFCKTYIDPKLAMIRQRFAAQTVDGV
ncbi:MAG: peptide-methionine (S)-S-oxide reductase [Pseudomonadota bacterium]